MKRLTGAVVVGALLFPSLAFGQTSVTILGLRSATADEQMAAQLTDALRRAADEVRSSAITHTGRENQLSQLLVVFDCEESTPRCMRDIGQSLNSQRLIYGLLEPESGRSDADYAVTLRYFNVESGEVERDLRERLPRNLSPQRLAERASNFLVALTGAAMPGSLAITCNAQGARVLIGDRVVGSTSIEPLVIRDIDPGNIVVEVRHDDYEPFRRSVTVEAGETLALDIALTELSRRSPDDVRSGGGGSGGERGSGSTEPVTDGERQSLAWLGWTMVGMSAVMGGLGLWSSLEVNSTVNDDQLRHNFPRNPDVHICDTDAVESSEGYSVTDAESRCNSAETFEILQAVFYPLAAVTFSVGLWLGIRETRRNSQEARRLQVVPVALRNGGALNATLRF